MKVILKQDVKDLGKKDSMVNVSDGYAKNYLIPRGIAVEATAGNINEMKNKQQAVDNKKKKELAEAQALADSLKDKVFVIRAKSGENGKLFGAIGNKDIAEAIQRDLSLNVDKKKIVVNEPFKAVGLFSVEARIYSGVTAKFQVKIEAE